MKIAFWLDVKDLVTKQHGQRPRTMRSRTGRAFATMYPVKEYVAFKERVGWEVSALMSTAGMTPFEKESDISVDATLFWPRGGRKRCPDIADNALSGVFDALQGIAYADDKQIARVTIERVATDGVVPVVYMEISEHLPMKEPKP